MKYLISFFFILFLFSCKKEPLTFTIKGIVNDLSFDKPLDKGEISIYRFTAGSSTPKLLETQEIGSDGTYHFKIERDKSEKYDIKIVRKNYFEKIYTINFSVLKPNEDNIHDIDVTAKSFIKFILKNQNSPQPSDELKFLKNVGNFDCKECCDKGYSFYNGIIDTVVYCANDGNKPFGFHYWVNGNEKYKEESLITPAFDTLNYELIY